MSIIMHQQTLGEKIQKGSNIVDQARTAGFTKDSTLVEASKTLPNDTIGKDQLDTNLLRLPM